MKILFREIPNGTKFKWSTFECTKKTDKVAKCENPRREMFFNGREIVNVEAVYEDEFTPDIEGFYGVPDLSFKSVGSSRNRDKCN